MRFQYDNLIETPIIEISIGLENTANIHISWLLYSALILKYNILIFQTIENFRMPISHNALVSEQHDFYTQLECSQVHQWVYIIFKAHLMILIYNSSNQTLTSEHATNAIWRENTNIVSGSGWSNRWGYGAFIHIAK